MSFSFQISLSGSFIFALITRMLNFFMDGFNMTSYIFCCCSFVRTLVTEIIKDFLDRIGHALNIYHTQYYTDELTDTIFFVTQQKYAGVNTSSNSLYDFLSLGFKTKQTIQSCEKSEPVWMCGCLG